MDAKRSDAETELYKMWMIVAQRIKRMDYASKWQIVPDIKDPLRKFTLERDIGWCTIKLGVSTEEYYHRTGDYNNRTDYRGRIVVHGMFADVRNKSEHYLNTGIKVKPRMAKKMIKIVNEAIIPQFYKNVEETRTQWEARRNQMCAFMAELRKVKGLKYKSERTTYGESNGSLAGSPFKIDCGEKSVSLSANMTYDQLAELAQAMKWGDYK